MYPTLFGAASRGIFPLSADLFSDLGHSSTDPRWLFHGVFEFSPTEQRSSWLYVTSGTSNPWEVEPSQFGEQEYSGLGTELVLESPVQAEWAISATRRLLAYNILLAHGHFGTSGPLDYGARIPLDAAIDGSAQSLLRSVVVGAATHYPSSFGLASGKVDLLHLVGISESEHQFARVHSSTELIKLLRQRDAFPVTDPARKSVA